MAFFSARRRSFRFGTTLSLLAPTAARKRTTRQEQWDLFIAHASRDEAIAERLYELLCSNCRPFLDKKCLKLGDEWDSELAKAQRLSLITVVLISPGTRHAYYQREEVAAAIALALRDDASHRVVPIYLDEAGNDEVPYGLRLRQGLRVNSEMPLSEVASRLLVLIGDVKSRPR